MSAAAFGSGYNTTARRTHCSRAPGSCARWLWGEGGKNSVKTVLCCLNGNTQQKVCYAFMWFLHGFYSLIFASNTKTFFLDFDPDSMASGSINMAVDQKLRYVFLGIVPLRCFASLVHFKGSFGCCPPPAASPRYCSSCARRHSCLLQPGASEGLSKWL